MGLLWVNQLSIGVRYDPKVSNIKDLDDSGTNPRSRSADECLFPNAELNSSVANSLHHRF